VVRGISDHEAKLLWEKDAEAARQLGVRRRKITDEAGKVSYLYSGVGYLHSFMKHYQEFGGMSQFDDELKTAMKNKDLGLFFISRHNLLNVFPYDLTSEVKTFAVLVTDSFGRLVSFYQAEESPSFAKNGKSILTTFEGLARDLDLKSYQTKALGEDSCSSAFMKDTGTPTFFNIKKQKMPGM
jgi:hypothetical protein